MYQPDAALFVALARAVERRLGEINWVVHLDFSIFSICCSFAFCSFWGCFGFRFARQIGQNLLKYQGFDPTEAHLCGASLEA